MSKTIEEQIEKLNVKAGDILVFKTSGYRFLDPDLFPDDKRPIIIHLRPDEDLYILIPIKIFSCLLGWLRGKR